jgi:hypothetical protein
MKTFGERFKDITDEAMNFIKEKVKENPELILCELHDEDGDIREEVYELPSQLLYRKYDIMTYKIWSLTLEGNTIYAHGIDSDDYDTSYVFTLDMSEMGYSTIIDIADWLS